MKKIFYIALTAVLGLAGTSCDREKLTYDSEPGEISGKTGTTKKQPGIHGDLYFLLAGATRGTDHTA